MRKEENRHGEAGEFTGGYRTLVTPFLGEVGGDVTACGACRALRRKEKGDGSDSSWRVR